MRLTTKGRFAVTAMIDLGLRQSAGPVTLAAISQHQQISLSYLEQLFGKLRRNALVESTRGPGGGYTLARSPADITVAEINPHVIALRDEFCVPRDDKRFHVLHADGARFVRDTPRRYDVLLVDGYDYDGMPESLASQAFYDDCHQALSADGLMAVNLHIERWNLQPGVYTLDGQISQPDGLRYLARVERLAVVEVLPTEVRSAVIRVQVPPDAAAAGSHPIQFDVRSTGEDVSQVKEKAAFLIPR